MNEIKTKLKEAEDDLRDLGPPLAASEAEKAQLLWAMVTEFVNSYKNAISGKFDQKRNKNEQVSGGAKIKMSFYGLYTEFQGYRACHTYDDHYIQRAIQLHEGDGLPGFPSVDVFVFLISPQLEKLKEPALELVSDVYAQLEQICSQLVNKIFQRFPTMVPEMMDVITKSLTKDRERARELVESVIDAERNYLFTNDKEYKESRQGIVRPGTDTMTMAGDMRNTNVPGQRPDMMMQREPDMMHR